MGHQDKLEMHYNLENVNIFSFKSTLIHITEFGFVCVSKCFSVKKNKVSAILLKE